MKKKWKILILLGLLLLVAGGVFASIQYSQRGIVTVQTGKVARQDLAAIVTASGEIKAAELHQYERQLRWVRSRGYTLRKAIT